MAKRKFVKRTKTEKPHARMPKALLMGCKIVEFLEGKRMRSTDVIAEGIGESPDYTDKILSQLAHAGIVVRKRGPAGGTMLAQPRIYLGQLERALCTVLPPVYPEDFKNPEARKMASRILAVFKDAQTAFGTPTLVG